MGRLRLRLLEYTGWSHAMQPEMYDATEVLINITRYTIMGDRLTLLLNASKNTDYIKKKASNKNCSEFYFL